MITIDKLRLENFRSFEDQELDISSLPDEVLVIGNNQNRPGANSNGAGKSSIFYGITWAMFGRWTPKGSGRIRADDIIRWGADQASVQLLLTQGKDSIDIKRTRGVERALSVKLNSEAQGYTATDAQVALLNLLGVDPNVDYIDDYCSSVLFTSNSIRAFAGPGMTSEQRLSMLSRFLKLEILDRACQLAAKKRNQFENKMNAANERFTLLDAEIKSLIIPDSETLFKWGKELKKAKSKLEEYEELAKIFSRREEIKARAVTLHSSIERTRVEADSVVATLSRRILESEKNLDIIAGAMTDKARLETEKISVNDQKMKEIIELSTLFSDARQTLHGEIRTVEHRIKALDGQINNVLRCPNCHAELMLLTDQLKIIDTVALTCDRDDWTVVMMEHSTQIEDVHRELLSLVQELNKLENQQKDNEELTTKIRILSTKIQRLPEIENSLKSDHDAIGKVKEGAEETIITLGDELLEVVEQAEAAEFGELPTEVDETIFELRARIEDITKRIQNAKTTEGIRGIRMLTLHKTSSELTVAQDGFEVYNFWRKGFPTIRRWMIEQYIPVIEQRVNDVLEFVDIDFTVAMQTMRNKSKGDDAYVDFNISVIDGRGNERPIETLSGGEERRAAIAIGLALRSLTHESGYLDFNCTFIDEIADSLDEAGRDELFRLLHTIPGRKLIVSHDSSLKNRFDTSIEVVNEHGISRLEVN